LTHGRISNTPRDPYSFLPLFLRYVQLRDRDALILEGVALDGLAIALGTYVSAGSWSADGYP
jgi:hypothetical protein